MNIRDFVEMIIEETLKDLESLREEIYEYYNQNITTIVINQKKELLSNYKRMVTKTSTSYKHVYFRYGNLVYDRQ